MVPRVRVNRDTADFRMTSPSTGDLQHQPVDHELAVRGRVVLLEGPEAEEGPDDQDPASKVRRKRPEELRQLDHDLRRQRQRDARFAEHLLEGRDDEDEQDADRAAGDRHDHAG